MKKTKPTRSSTTVRKKKPSYVYEVHRETPLGFYTMGLFKNVTDANKVANKWNKGDVAPWDLAAVSKREVK